MVYDFEGLIRLHNCDIAPGPEAANFWLCFELYAEQTKEGSGGNHLTPFFADLHESRAEAERDLMDRLFESHSLDYYEADNGLVWYDHTSLDKEGNKEIVFVSGRDHEAEFGDGSVVITTIKELFEHYRPLPIGTDRKRKRSLGANFHLFVRHLMHHDAVR